MLRVVMIRRKPRSPYPPSNGIMKPPPAPKTFKEVEIVNRFVPFRIKPEGARQSTVEANILSKIKAKVNGFASLNGDILGR